MKRIVVCCDGTWNKPGNLDNGIPVKTNVQKTYEALAATGSDGVPQVKYYGQGVGTRYKISDMLFGGIAGSGLDRQIMDAYKFIMWNFEEGDELFLFGFSRGAYTARSLIGFIRNCGIMKPEYLHLIEEGYQLYRDRNSITHPDSDLMVAFKRQYSRLSRIRFIGVWDTVGALGVPIKMLTWFNKEYEFHDVKLSADVDYAYHAVALDEKRALFQPTLWELSSSVRREQVKQEVEQVWFPGTHSNVGGGYADSGLSDIALDWMVQKAAALQLGFKEDYIKQSLKPDPAGEFRESANGIFSILSKVSREINKPVKGFNEDNTTGEITEYNIIRNEKIHLSCLEREKKVPKYQPRNLSKALTLKTPLFPDLDKWQPEWKALLKEPILNIYLTPVTDQTANSPLVNTDTVQK